MPIDIIVDTAGCQECFTVDDGALLSHLKTAVAEEWGLDETGFELARDTYTHNTSDTYSDLSALCHQDHVHVVASCLARMRSAQSFLIDQHCLSGTSNSQLSDCLLNAATLYDPCDSHSQEILRAALQAGADPCQLKILKAASDNGSLEILDLFSDVAERDLLFILSCRVADLTFAEHLLQNGGNVDARDGRGLHALFYACTEENFSVLDSLLQWGAKVDAVVGQLQQTCFLQSCIAGRHAVAERLHRAGADVNVQAENGASPMHYALSRGDVVLAVLLRAWGASTERRSSNEPQRSGVYSCGAGLGGGRGGGDWRSLHSRKIALQLRGCQRGQIERV